MRAIFSRSGSFGSLRAAPPRQATPAGKKSPDDELDDGHFFDELLLEHSDTFETQRSARKRFAGYMHARRTRVYRFKAWLALQRDAARDRVARRASRSYADPLSTARHSPKHLRQLLGAPTPSRRDPTKSAMASILLNLCIASTKVGERRSPPFATRAINMDFAEHALDAPFPAAPGRPVSPPHAPGPFTKRNPPSPPANTRSL